MKISKDIPISELTLRRYEKPYDLNKRELVRKLCLSSGLLQPGDSRDIIVDVLYALLIARKENQILTSEEVKDLVIDLRKENNLALAGIASSNIRRQLKRLRDVFLVEKIKNNYRITEFESLSAIFDNKVERFLLQSLTERVKEYMQRVDEVFQ